jgi:hypothetical protein
MPRPGARFAISSAQIRAAINPKGMRPLRFLLIGLMVYARSPSRAPRERASLSLLGLCRAGHRGRNRSRATLDRYAPRSGTLMCAPAVPRGAITDHCPRSDRGGPPVDQVGIEPHAGARR